MRPRAVARIGWSSSVKPRPAEGWDDNVVSGDVLFKGFDWHAQFDALGSRGEYTK